MLLLLPGLGHGLAATPPPLTTATAQPLAGALNPNGTLKAGLHGSFDPTGYVLGGHGAARLSARAADVAGTLGAGDENWRAGFDWPGSNGLERFPGQYCLREASGAFTVLVPAEAGTGQVQAKLRNALGQAVRSQAAATGAPFTVQTVGLAPDGYTLGLRAGAAVLAKRVVVQ